MAGLLTLRSCCFHCNTHPSSTSISTITCCTACVVEEVAANSPQGSRKTVLANCQQQICSWNWRPSRSSAACNHITIYRQVEVKPHVLLTVVRNGCLPSRFPRFTLEERAPVTHHTGRWDGRTDWVATGKFLPYRKSNGGRLSRHLRTGSRVMLRYGDANIRRPAGVALVEAWEGLWLLWRPPADPDASRTFNQFWSQSLQHVGFSGGSIIRRHRGAKQFTYRIDTRPRGGRSCRSGIGWTPSLYQKDTHCCQH